MRIVPLLWHQGHVFFSSSVQDDHSSRPIPQKHQRILKSKSPVDTCAPQKQSCQVLATCCLFFKPSTASTISSLNNVSFIGGDTVLECVHPGMASHVPTNWCAKRSCTASGHCSRVRSGPSKCLTHSISLMRVYSFHSCFAFFHFDATSLRRNRIPRLLRGTSFSSAGLLHSPTCATLTAVRGNLMRVFVSLCPGCQSVILIPRHVDHC